MVSNLTAFTITWLDETDNYSTTANITSDVMVSSLWTDTGSGEVNEAEIVLTAVGGKYANTGNVVEEFDRIRIQATDLGSNSYDRFFEVVDIIPSQTKEDGSVITLKCLGIEYHTQLIHYSARHFSTNPFWVGQSVGLQYESNNGSRQPTIDRHDESYSLTNKYGNGLPKFTLNHYEFGLVEESCYNRWMDLIDSLGGSVASGGVGDFFEIGFETPSVNVIELAIFTSGARTIDGNDSSNDSSLTTITNTTALNVSEQEGGISNPTGTVVLAWGSPSHGSLPFDLSKYRGEELEFLYRPDWQTGLEYVVNSKVLESGKHYNCDVAHTAGTFATDLAAGKWSQIDMSTEFGDSVQYSPWTDDKAVLWANGGSDPSGLSTISAWTTSTAYTMGDCVSNGGNQYTCIIKHTSGTFATDLSNGKWELVDNAKTGNGAGFFDSNLVVNDTNSFRTWVNEIAGDTDYNGTTETALDTAYKHTNNEWPIGYRFLNVNTNTFLSGTDRYGRDFADAIVERVVQKVAEENASEWVVKYTPDSTTDRMQVAVIDDGTMWEWNDSASEWQEITTQEFANDCFHQYKSIYNIAGADPRPAETNNTKYPEITSDGNPFSTNIRSAVEVAYEYSTFDSFPTTAAGYKKYAGINFSFPFPTNSLNSISEGLGDIFGGGTNESTPCHPSLLDTQNMTYTPTGLQGFNQTDSVNLGPLQSIAFFTRMALQDVSGNALDGIANMRCTIYDSKDNVAVQDFEIKFTDGYTWQEINLPFSGFSIYRARTPKSIALRALSITGFEIPLNELDVQNIFEWRNIKHISIQLQDFYDEDGRYNPEKNMFAFSNTGFSTLGGGTVRLAIDAFHFKKVLLATSGADTTRNIQPVFLQRPNIISFRQLTNDTKSELEIHKFKHKEFNFQTSGDDVFDIRFGDSFFLKNDDLISDTDDSSDGTAKKIKLVAKRIEYHLTKPTVGPGGLTRTIKGVKRFS